MDIEWLDGLETRVRDAVARLEELGEENRALRAQIKTLETRLAAASTSASETERAEAAAAAKSWEIEREEVRRRVEGLVARLEGLTSI